MSDSETIVEDPTIENHPIIERKLNFNGEKQKWVFSSPKTLYKKTKRTFKCLDLIKQLVANDQPEDSKKAEKSETIKPINSNTDSGFESELSFCIVRSEPGNWEPPKLEIGNFYFVPSDKSSSTKWSCAKLAEICANGFFKLLSDPHQDEIWTTCTNLAYLEQDVTFKVGSRIVGQCYHNKVTGEVNCGKAKFRLGVVTEEPSALNKQRYLIIFDDGGWRYVNPQSVWLINFQSKDIWRILPTASRVIVKKFLNNGYNKVINYKIGDYVTHKFLHNEEVCGTVVCIDCSIVLVWFYGSNTSVWLHQRSPFMFKTTVDFDK